MVQSRSQPDCVSKSSSQSTTLHRDITAYALATGAAGVSILALNSPAAAEVVYTKVNQTIDRHQGFAIDLNHDGIVDFRVQNLFRVITEGGYPYIQVFDLLVRPADGVQAGKGLENAAALSSGANIGPIQPARTNAFLAEQVRTSGFGTYYSGSWLNVSNRYLGLAFRINGETHYGWARLSVRWNHKWAIAADITGYAYETVANQPIVAGDTGGNEAGENSGPTGRPFSEPSAPEDRPATLGALALGALRSTVSGRR